MFHESAMETESKSPKIGTLASSWDVGLFCGKDSRGHGSSTMASENKLEALERDVVGESRSLLCEKGRLWVVVTRRGRWLLGELGAVDEGEAAQVMMLSTGTGMVELSRLREDSGIHGDVKEYSLSSPLRASSRKSSMNFSRLWVGC
jgi:hypothetical protein